MQKLEGTEDPRVRRTRKLLQQAFIECTVEKGFAALTVRDVTERAMVNRSTFYRHYLDKYDMLEQYMNEIYAFFENQEVIAKSHSYEASSVLIDLLKHIQQNADFYRVMLGAKGDPLFAERFRQKTEKRFLSCFNQVFPERVGESDTPPLDLKFNVIASAGCGAIVWWLEQDQSCPPEQLAHWLNQLIYDISVSSVKLKGAENHV
ncbi:MAG: TetR/AcrR family transcriptional regulator [Ktedonobacteraceae bacterium]|nr:TetR/AcrR family transcriptional regulator [Ktedonobacteraceae bacterium]